MKYTKIPTDTFAEMQLNAGVLLSSFTPASAAATGIIGATSGGVNFKATPSFVDIGEDIDNCPKNTKELKKLDGWDVKLSGSFVTVTAGLVKTLIGAADVGTTDTTKITPRVDLDEDDFDDLWWVGDYSDKNGETNGGYVAIHMLNSLSTGGFQIQSTDKNKGTFQFEFTAHTSMSAQTVAPFEVYVKSGTAEPTSGDNQGT